MINNIKFCLNMIRKYENRYPQMPTDILVDIIDVVLNRAPDAYFTYDMVQDHLEFCKKCGNCCRALDCDYFKGGICDDYDSRYDACKEFPWYEILNETGLMLDCDCHFAIELAELVLDEEFEKNINLLDID